MTETEIEALHREYRHSRRLDLCNQLMAVHQGLAVHFALRYVSPGFSADEAVSAAYRGLHAALERYSPGRGKFSTFAYWWVHKYVLREKMQTKNLVKLPVGAVRKSRKVRQLRDRGLPDAEIARQLKLTEDMVFELGHLHETSSTPVSLTANSIGVDYAPKKNSFNERQVANSGSDVLETPEAYCNVTWVSCPDPGPTPREELEGKEAMTSGEDKAEANSPAARLSEALEALPDRQQKIILGRMTSPPTPFRELSKAVGMSQEGCRKMFMKAMTRLKHTLTTEDNG